MKQNKLWDLHLLKEHSCLRQLKEDSCLRQEFLMVTQFLLTRNLKLLKKLEGVAAKIETGVETKGTVQLRFEGIDTIEKGATKPLSVEAKESMLSLIGYDAETKPEPKGHILSRMIVPHGRPVTFVFAGNNPEPDGSDLFLKASRVGSSVNYLHMEAGYAYPLYYNTLFAELRSKFNQALDKAKLDHKGYWPKDKTTSGVIVDAKASLATIKPVWPKLWRRFQEYIRNHNSMNELIDWLDAKNERIIIIDTADEKGLINVVKVNGNKVKLTVDPKNIMVITATKR